MASYAIGDIQGCHEQLLALLDKINFDKNHDMLWFCGDLVNRGPRSLDTLRFVYQLGDRAITVLGNHDLHLLAAAYDPSHNYPVTSLEEILAAPDREELINWLRHRPLFHQDNTLGYNMVHAGIPPQWDLQQTQQYASEVEQVLRHQPLEFLSNMYGNKPNRWDNTLQGWDRIRYITNCLTRLRYCDNQGQLELTYNGAPGGQPAPFIPWFKVAQRATQNERIIFGHWSSLGEINHGNVFALDTGCLWGGALTALCLETQQLISLKCPETQNPQDFIKQ